MAGTVYWNSGVGAYVDAETGQTVSAPAGMPAVGTAVQNNVWIPGVGVVPANSPQAIAANIGGNTGDPVGGGNQDSQVLPEELESLPGVGWLVGLLNAGAGALGIGSGGTGLSGVVGSTGGVPFGGPGVPEPPAAMVAKSWKTKAFSNTKGEYWVYYWKLIDGRIMMWNAAGGIGNGEVKIWKPKKPIVSAVYPGKLNLAQYIKMERYLDRTTRAIAKRTKSLKRQ